MKAGSFTFMLRALLARLRSRKTQSINLKGGKDVALHFHNCTVNITVPDDRAELQYLNSKLDQIQKEAKKMNDQILTALAALNDATNAVGERVSLVSTGIGTIKSNLDNIAVDLQTLAEQISSNVDKDAILAALGATQEKLTANAAALDTATTGLDALADYSGTLAAQTADPVPQPPPIVEPPVVGGPPVD